MSAKETESVSAPSTGIRLLCWFTIYLGGIVPLWNLKASSRAVLDYPLGLIPALCLTFPRWNDFVGRHMTPLMILAYGIFLAHLAVSLWVSGRKTFCALLVGLLALVAYETFCIYL